MSCAILPSIELCGRVSIQTVCRSEKPPLTDQQKRKRLTLAVAETQLASVDEAVHKKTIWSDETSVVLRKYGTQTLTRLEAEKFDKACLAYSFKKAMISIFSGEIGYNFKG